MSYLTNLLVAGIAVGALYGLVAMGFAVIFKVSRVVNFAQGEVMMLIAYIAYTVALRTDGSMPYVMATVVVSSIVVGMVIERLIIRPMLGQPIFSTVMMTIALSVLIRSLVGLGWGNDPHRFPGSEAIAPWKVLGLTILPAQGLLIVVYVALCFAVWLFLRYNIIGIAMRATAADSTVALLMGASVGRLYQIAWILSALIAGCGGVFFGNLYQIGPDLGAIGIRAFPATILGGLDSVIGSAAGGVIIGIIENLAGGYIGTGYKEIAGFVVIIFVLMVRPYGLFGEKEIERV